MNSTFTLCQIDDLQKNTSKGFTLKPQGDGHQNAIEATVFAIKKETGIFIYRNHCPHLGLPLEWMPNQFLDREGQYIQCATHGALFRIDNGLCVSGPCSGESLTPVPFRIEGKSIIINSSCLSEKT